MEGENNHQLQVGAARVEITPERGTHLAGSIADYRPARSIEDPLYASALLLESDGQLLCLVSVDVTIITRVYTNRIRQDLGRKFGLDAGAVMIHATQTHSAPAIGGFMLSPEFDLPDEFSWLRGSDPEYSSFATEQIKESVRRAHNRLEPVQVAYGRGIEGTVAFNRRAVRRDGSVFMPGRRWTDSLGPTDILHLEGPIDPELGLIAFRNSSSNLTSIITNYTCHPVHIFPKPVVSADWPGNLARRLRLDLGNQCIPIILNGCCGNINPWPPFEPDYFESHERMGRVLSNRVRSIIPTLEFSNDPELDHENNIAPLPLREIDGNELQAARDLLEREPSPKWNPRGDGVDQKWVMAAGLLDLHRLRRKSSYFDYQIQAFRIGSSGLVGLPGEPFVEGQLRIKRESPAQFTYAAHDVGHYAGYLPTREAFARGGHETRTGNWSRFAPGSLEMVVNRSVKLLDELFPERLISSPQGEKR